MGNDFLRGFLEKRGIAPDGEVARARGYAAYAAGDVDAVYAAAGSIMEKEDGGRRNPDWVEKFTRSEGFVIPKHRVFEHLPQIRPQLRPRHPVVEEIWRHNHSDNAVDKDGEPLSAAALAAHRNSKNRAKEHVRVGPKREHEHKEVAKYGIAPKEDMVLWDGGRWLFDDSKRLDRNPVSDFSLPGPVFFGIEGTPKNDAMVEWLRNRGRPAKVVNVPSVSTWRAPELALFALRHMQGWPVAIVPDADWSTNDEVIYHAENCVLYLRLVCGVDAIIAAPPVGFGREVDDKGVDDYLGPDYGGSLDDLHVIRREFDQAALAEFEDEYQSVHRARGDKPKTLEPTLQLARLLGRTSGANGTTLRSVAALASLRFGRRITEEEALAISKPDFLPRWSNPVSAAYAHIRRGNQEYTDAQERKTSHDLERLAGIAYEYTGMFPDWVEPHWETVGWKKDKKTGKMKPKRVRKKGAPGSRIEFLRVDERLRMHQLEPEPLAAYLARQAAI
jgi:hypothetical protein